MLCRLLVPLVVLAASSSGAAQQTFVVDPAGGPGVQFTEIQDAVVAASPGDVIEARAGVYSFGVTIDKTLTIYAEPGASIGTFRPLTIENIPAGSRVLVVGLDLVQTFVGVANLTVADCVGEVHLEDVTSDLSANVLRCSDVSFHRCSIGGSFALDVIDSNVVVTESLLDGALQLGAGLRAENSNIALAGSTLTGGNAVGTLFPPSPGAILVSGTMTIANGTGTRIIAGVGSFGGGMPPTPAIQTGGGSLTIHPAVGLVPSNGGAPIDGAATVSMPRVGAVDIGPTAVGQAATITVHGPAGSTAFTLLNIGGPPLSTPFGDLWMPVPAIVVDSGPLGPSRTRLVPLTVPATFGVPDAFRIQAVLLDAGQLSLTTPVSTIIRP